LQCVLLAIFVICQFVWFGVIVVQETITTGIHFSDYEQVKMSNKTLDEKLEERNEVSRLQLLLMKFPSQL